jgi:hypothetical protein
MCMHGLMQDGMILRSGQYTSPFPLLHDANNIHYFMFNGNKINNFKLYMQFHINKHSIFIVSEPKVIWIYFGVGSFETLLHTSFLFGCTHYNIPYNCWSSQETLVREIPPTAVISI